RGGFSPLDLSKEVIGLLYLASFSFIEDLQFLVSIFGIDDEPMTPGQCNMIVDRLGDYLID
ncbi:hypothetical protein AMTR_s01034p00010100, partial [Amborella trichopoda]